MSDSVVARVADRLEIQPEQTDRVLRTLAQLIKKQSARDGQVRVPGLGVFEQTNDDALHFEPDATLAEAINFRFAGLETVPLNLSPEADTDTEPEAVQEDTVLPPPLPVATDAPSAADDTLTDEPEETPAAEAPLVAEEEEHLAEDAEPIAEDAAPAAEDVEPVTDDHLAEEDVLAEGEEPTEVTEENQEETPPEVEEPVAAEDPADEEGVHAGIPDLMPVAAVPIAEDDADDGASDAEDMLSEDATAEDETPDADTDEAFVPLLDPEDYDDPDISEAAAYKRLQETVKDFDEQTFSEWAPPGSTWSQEDLEALSQESLPEPTEDAQDEKEDEPTLVDPPALFSPALPEDNVEDTQAPIFTLPDRTADLPPKPPQPLNVQHTPKKARRSVSPWLLLFAAVLVIGAGTWYFLGLPGLPSTNTDPPITVVDPTTETPPEAAPTATETQNDAEATPTNGANPDDATTDAAQTPQETPPQETPPPTSSGQAIDRAQGGYTLVAGSFPERDTAEREVTRWRQRLSNESVPVDVIQGESNGSIRYRVAIGQVTTIDEATALRDRLAASLPQGTWVTRITADS